jgi:transposase-like protein
MQNGLPETLQEAVQYFSDKQVCHDLMVAIRWPEGVTCPFCVSAEHSFISTRFTWQCKGCNKQFSTKVGTIFEDSPITLDKWFVAMWLLANCKNGISSYELARDLGVTQKTGWFMLHRLRLAMRAKSFDRKLCGIVEADETFVGGSLKNMHKSKRERIMNDEMPERTKRAAEHRQLGKKRRIRTGIGPSLGKTIVQACLERDGEVRAQILSTLGTLERASFMVDHIDEGSRVMTDTGNAWLGPKFLHEFINHQHEYVRGNVHTQGIESFWALLKRGLNGTYISVEPYHLSAYVDEQCFRFNQRKRTDGERFTKVLSQVSGRRLTYADLTQSKPSVN